MYVDDDDDLAQLDQDGDGASDLLENDAGTDEFDPNDSPVQPVTNLKARMMKTDIDLDGLSNEDEKARGTIVNNPDSDGDGFRDGSERRAGTDPKNDQDFPMDSDDDGLGDEYERTVGLNPYSRDTDGDLLDDEMETVFSTDGLHRDTDRDGLLDGKELQLGSDPLLPEVPNRNG